MARAFLNELSLLEPAPSVGDAIEGMNALYRLLRDVAGRGGPTRMYVPEEFHQLQLADNYPVQTYLADNRVDRELRRRWRGIAASTNYSQDLVTTAAPRLVEGSCQGRTCLGLTLARLTGGIALSKFIEAFDRPWAELSLTWLQAGETDNDVTEEAEVLQARHASCSAHLDEHESWFRPSPQSWAELVETVATLTPSLLYTDTALDQLGAGHHQSAVFETTLSILQALNSAAEVWTGGPFNPQLPVAYSGESKTVHSSPTLLAKRRFKWKGEELQFDLHAKIGLGVGWRVYFLPPTPQRGCVVGYFGPHLPTAKY